MKTVLTLLLFLTINVMANNVYTKTYDVSMQTLYPKLLNAMNKAHLVVVSEIDILGKFKAAGLPKAFGKNFNTNNLTGIKAVIACNGWFGNEVANSDPEMMAYCPVRVTVVERDGKTTISYVKASSAPKDSQAYPILKKLTHKVVTIIDSL